MARWLARRFPVSGEVDCRFDDADRLDETLALWSPAEGDAFSEGGSAGEPAPCRKAAAG